MLWQNNGDDMNNKDSYNAFAPENIKLWQVVLFPFGVILLWLVLSFAGAIDILKEGIDRLRYND